MHTTSAAARPARIAGRLFVAVLLLGAAFAACAAPGIEQMLKRADATKLDDNTAFRALLQQLDAQASALTPAQRDWLDYLHAWQLGYSGEYPKALTAFRDLLVRVQDPTLRARARISLIYDQVNASQFEDAYLTLNKLLDALPQLQDAQARFLVFDTAAYLYADAGQFDLALAYLDQADDASYDAASSCIVAADRVAALFKAGKLRSDDAHIAPALAICDKAGVLFDKISVFLYQARALIVENRPLEAIKLLKAHDAAIVASHSAAATSDFRAVLAQACLAAGELDDAARYAQSAVAYANQQPFAKSVADSFNVLYQVAKRQGDVPAALAWHEKYAKADKGYLDDVTTRTLAYQMVHQRVLDNQRQVDVAISRNKVLALQQQYDAQKARTRLLYVLLLLAVLVTVVGWAYRTKRSQLKFQKLARRDGLTGICNRQHFLDSAHDALRYCAKASREASLLVLDLDHFKSVNDMHGHAAGDEALRRVVAACQARLRSIDIFGRLGGEEFAILLPDCAENTAQARAEEMRNDIADLPRFDAYADVLVTASFGVASSRTCGHNLTTLLANADRALYQAKNSGRNKIARFQPHSPAAASN